MKSKQFNLIALLLVVILLISACGGGEEATATPQPKPTEPEKVEVQPTEAPMEKEGECPLAVEEGAEITFSGWGDETEQQVYRDSIERFKAVCPDVTVNFEPIPADFQTKLKAQMAGGTAPDVFYVDDQLMTAFAPSGQLLPLDDYMAEAGVSRDDYIPSLLTIFTLDGQTYGLPKDWGTLGLVYIPEVFDEAGVDYPSADWTWDDLRAAAKTIADNTGYGGFCQNADWARFAPWAFSNGGAYASDDYSAPLLDTPEVKEMAQLVFEMYDEGSLVQASDVGASWCGEAIGKKLVGLTLEGGWMVNFMRQNYPDQDWTAVLVPQGPKTRADVIFTNAIGVNAATQYPQAAAAFTIFVTGRENQAEIVATGFAYSTHPDQVDLVIDPNDKAIAGGGLLPDSRVAYWGPNTGKVNDVVSKALERVYLRDQDVDEAFAQAQEEAAEFLVGGGETMGPISEEPAAPEGCPLAVEEGAEITFSGWGDETEQQIYRDSIERFKAVCPDVTVNFEPIPADFQTKLKAQMAGGTAPDVFYVDDQLMTAFAPSGQLLPLDDYMAKAGVSRDDYIPSLLTIFTLDGQTYGLPKDWGTLGLVYIPEVFDEAGVDYPSADWTWDDLRAAAKTIADNTDYGGFCQNADWARFAPWAFSNGGAYASDDYSSATLDTPEVKEMAQLVFEMYDEGSLVQASDVGASWCGEAIGKKLVGLTLEGGWMVNFMRQNYPDQDWTAVLVPQGPQTRADVIFTNAIGVNAATKYPQAAAAFTIFVTGRENQAEIVATGFAYSTHPDQVDLVIDPNDKAIAGGGLLPDSRVAYWGPNTGKVNDVVSKALERVYLRDQDVDEAFAQAQEEAQEALSGE